MNILITILLTTFAVAPMQQQEEQQPDAMSQWVDRLELLAPEDPLAYFELGEEVQDAATTRQERALARALFGLAGLLDRAALGRSAALAIASLEETPLAKRRLEAAAALLGAGRSIDLGGQESNGQFEGTWEGRLAFCNALGALRRGDGSRAVRHLDVADARGVANRLAPLLPGGQTRLERDIEVHRGGLRPDMSEAEVETQLIAESIALAERAPSFAFALHRWRSAPLIVVDLTELDRLFGADATKPYYRNNRWVTRREAR